ncbi:ROK family transcriptional regulator [Aquisalinus flavus]|uniref:Sugar kinase n=1 Tax=Aquisalinus flavus TaxID=1526572 RepID=A0A8J2V477_9PROT|nr:ROK family transcriptional regulator [Aquisalinus flavus]MBD0427375.1 ROK family transcriptional regulator [Aquisalinus flavus]UNE47180.1 ROK family transcriptional regulator [Aquisalinus flavus]GGD00513.1 sugar kinase [Aquisalinus flavus]
MVDVSDSTDIEDGERKLSGAGLAGTNLERAGGYNQRVTLQAIRINGPVTRSELVELTGLTGPAIANITRRLLDTGLIENIGRVQGARGQPAMRFAINPDGRFAIGLNIDRDYVTMVAVDFYGRIKARATTNRKFAMPDEVGAFFRDNLELFFIRDGIPRSKVMGVGIAVPDDLGTIESNDRPPAYEAWAGYDLREMIHAVADYPVFIENDAAAAAIGELQFGHGLQSSNFLYLLVTSGLGAGLVVEGSYFRGAHGRSGELGFLPVSSPLTKAKTLSEVVSVAGLKSHMASRSHPLARLADVEGLQGAAKTACDEWLSLAVEALTGPIISTVYLMDPDAVYIGGRLPRSLIDRMVASLNDAIAARGVKIPPSFRVASAALSADAPAVGAAIMPFSDMLLPNRASLMKAVAAD